MKSGNEKNTLQEQKIKIMNCNCIDSAEISIKANALNIKYGQGNLQLVRRFYIFQIKMLRSYQN